MSDARIVYGARCTWWDSISQVATVGPYRIPCCPHCSSPLFEVDDEAEWFRQVDKFEREKPQPGYRAVIEWARGKCFQGASAMFAAFEARPQQ